MAEESTENEETKGTKRHRSYKQILDDLKAQSNELDDRLESLESEFALVKAQRQVIQDLVAKYE